jgi:hypothetical protein
MDPFFTLTEVVGYGMQGPAAAGARNAGRNGMEWINRTRTPRLGGWEKRRKGDVRGKGTVRAPAGLSGDGDGDGDRRGGNGSERGNGTKGHQPKESVSAPHIKLQDRRNLYRFWIKYIRFGTVLCL